MLDFLTDRSGNFAIITAVAIVPLALGAGLAVDFSRISSARSDLQQALDSAALAIQSQVKEVPQAQADALANQYLAANFRETLTDVKVVRSGTTVSVSARTPVQLAFGGLMGYDQWPIVAASLADVAFASYEIALVLDTTGSMKGGKLAAMQDAVIGLVDSMTDQVDDEGITEMKCNRATNAPSRAPWEEEGIVGFELDPGKTAKGEVARPTLSPYASGSRCVFRYSAV